LNNLAMVQLERDSVTDADANARRAVSLEPDAPALADTLGVALLRAGKTEEAVSVLQGAHEAAPQSGSIGFHLAQALAAKGDVKSAIATLQAVLDADRRFSDRGAAEALLASLKQ
ncbi:tetratricopeptide repeat protein, partial [Gillisia sp. Q332]|uniref:tetratricopeptide repeat protein n=1 Tax=Gillisia xinjiangensis TaxID=3384765 RepID=UPI00391BE551